MVHLQISLCIQQTRAKHTQSYSHLPHHQDSYQDEDAEPACNMPSLFPAGMLLFQPQESAK